MANCALVRCTGLKAQPGFYDILVWKRKLGTGWLLVCKNIRACPRVPPTWNIHQAPRQKHRGFSIDKPLRCSPIYNLHKWKNQRFTERIMTRPSKHGSFHSQQAFICSHHHQQLMVMHSQSCIFFMWEWNRSETEFIEGVWKKDIKVYFALPGYNSG